MTLHVGMEKRTAAAKAVKYRLFTARLNPCPSLVALFPWLLRSTRNAGTGRLFKLKKLTWTGLAEL